MLRVGKGWRLATLADAVGAGRVHGRLDRRRYHDRCVRPAADGPSAPAARPPLPCQLPV